MSDQTPIPLRLHARIYPKTALAATAEAYADFAKLSVAKDGAYWRVALTPTSDEVEPQLLALEILNFALAESVHAQRGADA